jgi:hypothetical protein
MAVGRERGEGAVRKEDRRSRVSEVGSVTGLLTGRIVVAVVELGADAGACQRSDGVPRTIYDLRRDFRGVFGRHDMDEHELR